MPNSNEERIFVMKKFLSVMMALLMVLSVLAIAGCTKNGSSGDENEDAKPKTNAELFNYAMEQLMAPEIFADMLGIVQYEDVNHVNISVDELEVAAPGVAEMPTLPKLEIDGVFTGEESGIATLIATLEDETVKFIVEATEDGKVYLSAPEATEKYIVTTLEQFTELGVFEPDSGDTPQAFESFAAIAEKLEGIGEHVIKDENLTKESADVEVFGESMTLDKLTLKLDLDAILDIAEEFMGELMEVLPEEMTGGEMPDFDELREEMKDGLAVDFALSFYLDGEDVKKLELDVAVESEGEKAEIGGELDVLNSDEAYKLKGEIKVNALGEEMAKIGLDTDITLKDGKLEGESKITPELNLEAMEAPAEAAAILEDLSIGFAVEGEVKEKAFDVEYEYGVTVAGMTVKLPLTLKGEKEDGKSTLDIDVDFNLMGAKLVFAATVTGEKIDGVKAGSYEADNAVAIDDEDAMNELGEELEEYFGGLEKFAELFSGMTQTAPEYDDEFYPEDDDAEGYDTLFNIYNDEIDVYFYKNGSGVIVNDYDL